MKESEISASIRLTLANGDVRLFRNNVGAFLQCDCPTEKAMSILRRAGVGVRVTHVGLCPGSSDLIGARTLTVRPDMVGQRIAVFSAIETKRPNARTNPERLRSQLNFIGMVSEMGGYAGIATSVTEARQILRL